MGHRRHCGRRGEAHPPDAWAKAGIMTTACLGDQPSECVRHRRRDGRDTLTGWHTQRSARLPIDVSTASGFEVLANDRLLFVPGIVSRYPGDQLPVIPRQLQLCGAGLLRCGLLAAARRRLQLFFFGWTDERRQRFVDAEAVLVEVSEDSGTSRTTEGLAGCLLYTSPSPRDKRQSRMPSSA